MPVFVTLACVMLMRQFDSVIALFNLALLASVVLCLRKPGALAPLAGPATRGISIVRGYVPYLVVAFAATVTSPWPGHSFYNFVKEVLFLLLILGLFRALQTMEDGLDGFMSTLLVTAYLASFSVILEFAFRLVTGRLGSGSDARVSGIFGNPSAPGHLLATIVPILIAYSATVRQRRGVRPLFWATMLALLLTQSRSGTAAFLLATGLVKLSLASRRVRVWSTVVGGLIAMGVVAVVLSAADLDDLLLLFRVANGLSGRDVLWERCLEIVDAHPWLGVGLDCLRYEFLGAGIPRDGMREANQIIAAYAEDMDLTGFEEGAFGAVVGGSSHNLFVDVAVTTGLLGLGAIVFFIIKAIRNLMLREGLTPAAQRYARACLLVFCVYLLRAQFEPAGLVKGAISANIPIWLTLLSPFCLRVGRGPSSPGSADVPALV